MYSIPTTYNTNTAINAQGIKEICLDYVDGHLKLNRNTFYAHKLSNGCATRTSKKAK